SAMKLVGALVGQSLPKTRGSARDGAGRVGTDPSGDAKSKADVRSPTTERRQALKFVTSTPKRRSRNSSVEVRSKVSEQTKPPRLKGDATSIGTRKPNPIGPRTPSAADGNGSTVTYSPGVPGGAVGGGTWSKKPPFSSQLTNSAVFFQILGCEISASIT